MVYFCFICSSTSECDLIWCGPSKSSDFYTSIFSYDEATKLEDNLYHWSD